MPNSLIHMVCLLALLDKNPFCRLLSLQGYVILDRGGPDNEHRSSGYPDACRSIAIQGYVIGGDRGPDNGHRPGGYPDACRITEQL